MMIKKKPERKSGKLTKKYMFEKNLFYLLTKIDFYKTNCDGLGNLEAIGPIPFIIDQKYLTSPLYYCATEHK